MYYAHEPALKRPVKQTNASEYITLDSLIMGITGDGIPEFPPDTPDLIRDQC